MFSHNSGQVTELSNINFQSEKILQTTIETNLEGIFEGLEFLTTEFQLDGLRPDTIAFDTEKNCFVIIEYKNVKNKQVLDQGATYYRMLMEKQDSFVLLYNGIKSKQHDSKNFNWDESYVIFISPEFTKYQIGASGLKKLPIMLYEISCYDKGIFILKRMEDRLNHKYDKTVNSTDKPKNYIKLDEYDEEEYLNHGYNTGNASDGTRKLYFSIKTTLLEKFEDLEIKIRKAYVGFYNKNNDSCICTLSVQKSSIKLCYSTTVKKGIISESDFIRNVEKTGALGVGHYQSDIKNEDDLNKSLPYIEKVYNHKLPN